MKAVTCIPCIVFLILTAKYTTDIISTWYSSSALLFSYSWSELTYAGNCSSGILASFGISDQERREKGRGKEGEQEGGSWNMHHVFMEIKMQTLAVHMNWNCRETSLLNSYWIYHKLPHEVNVCKLRLGNIMYFQWMVHLSSLFLIQAKIGT